MEVYYITIGTSEGWTKKPQKDIARTLLTKESCGGGVLIVEEIKCEQVGLLSGEKWEKMHDISRRVYSPEGLSPTLHTCGGGNLEPKIMVKSANMKGYETATLGDSIVVNVLMALFNQML